MTWHDFFTGPGPFFVNAITLGGVGWYTWLTRGIAKSAGRQVEIMIAQNDVDMRPYLAIESENTGLEVQQDARGAVAETTDFIHFRFSITNCGRVPLRFGVTLGEYDGHTADPQAGEASVLFPSQKTIYGLRVPIPPTRVAALAGVGKVRFTYQRLGKEKPAPYFYERHFRLDIAAKHATFLKEDAD